MLVRHLLCSSRQPSDGQMEVHAAFRVNLRGRSAQITDGGYYCIQNTQILSARYSESLSIQVHGKTNNFFIPSQ